MFCHCASTVRLALLSSSQVERQRASLKEVGLEVRRAGCENSRGVIIFMVTMDEGVVVRGLGVYKQQMSTTQCKEKMAIQNEYVNPSPG